MERVREQQALVFLPGEGPRFVTPSHLALCFSISRTLVLLLKGFENTGEITLQRLADHSEDRIVAKLIA